MEIFIKGGQMDFFSAKIQLIQAMAAHLCPPGCSRSGRDDQTHIVSTTYSLPQTEKTILVVSYLAEPNSLGSLNGVL